MKKFLLTLLGVLIALPAFARDFTYEYEGKTLIYTVIDEGAKTCKTTNGWYNYPNYYPGNSVSGKLTIPSVAKDGDTEYSVIDIGNHAFYNCTGLTSVTIPNSVTSIGEFAFSNCKGLTQLTIGNSVTSIGAGSFYNCTGLTSVTIPNSVTSIGSSAFNGCYDLTQVSIPNSVTSIGSQAFQYCTGLTQLTIGNSVTSIGSQTFQNCFRLTSVIIPNSVESIGDNAFQGCSGLTSVTIPNSVTSIGEAAFYYCRGLTSVTIPNSVTSIGGSAFSGCSELTQLTIGNSVTSIGSKAFQYCRGLTSVIIPNSVEYIGKQAFDRCDGLKKSAYPNTFSNPFPSGICIAYNPKGAMIENDIIFGPDEASIIFAPISLSGEYVIPETVTSIEAQAFEGCTGLTSVIIPNSVKSIDDNAFQGCTGLWKSAYPKTFRNPFPSGIGIAYNPEGAMIENGFIFGPDKTSIIFVPMSLSGEYVIPETVTSIGSNAFRYCSSLTNITVESSSPASIKADSFNGLYDTATLTIPEGSFYAYASSPTWGQFKKIKFANSSEIFDYKTFDDGVLTYRLNTIDKTAIVTGANTSAITIPERFTDDSDPANPVRYYVTAIGTEAFKEKTIESFAFNSRSKLEYIGESAFANSTLQAISLPETVKTIGPDAFYGCSSLTKAEFASIEALCAIEFGNSDANPISSIKRLYIGDEEVTNLVIPESVTAIGNYAFYNCNGLTQVTIGNSVTSIGAGSFYNCTGLTQVTIGDSVESIGSYAFNSCSGLTQVTIPKSVTSIGPDAFKGCSSLAKAEFASIEALCAIEFGNSDANPLSYASLYIGGEKVTEVVIPESVTAIGDYTFNHCTGLTQVTIPKSVTSIGKGAFSYCRGLTQVTIPNSVTSIGSYAFYYCYGLTQVTIPNYVTSIGDYAFSHSGLTQVTIPNSVTSIGSYAFYCSGLTSITMVDGKEPIDIASDAFRNIRPTSLYWGRPCESLNIDCSEVTDLTIGNCTEEIPAGQFKNHSKLTKLTLGSSLTAIGDGAFSGCTELAEVIVPPAVESIGAEAFAGNSKLASIIMGSNLKTIGDKAFDGCPASTVSITAKTPPTAPNTTFSNYSGKLYLVDKAAADAYYDAYTCWDRFNSYVMVTPERMEGGQTEIKGVAGEQIQLTATLWPENVTLPQVFWRSTNPEVATVDENGLVTLHVDINRSRSISDGCKIIAESLYGSELEFNVLDPQSGIIEVTIDGGNTPVAVDYTAPYEIYNLNGVCLGSDLGTVAPGLYIIRQGKAVEKRIVR